MLDLERMRRVKLRAVPYGQLAVAPALLVDYRFPKKTEIVFEGEENVSRERPVFFAMNHTDRYSYWPFQLKLFLKRRGFTATWVKGKYYENPWLARFLDLTNNIPLPSRGYVLSVEFQKAIGREPSRPEYRVLRDLADTPLHQAPTLPDELPDELGDALARFIGDDVERFVDTFAETFAAYAQEAVRLNRVAMEQFGLHVLVFPEGTRSRRLGVGRTGLAQMAQALGAAIVPVGCSGSDLAYPGNAPFSKGGRIVYRFGKPLEVDGPELGHYRVPPDVQPLSREAQRYEASYEAITKVVMGELAELLDDEYRPVR